MGFAVEIGQSASTVQLPEQAIDSHAEELPVDERRPRLGTFVFLTINFALIVFVESLFGADTQAQISSLASVLCVALTGLVCAIEYRVVFRPLIAALQGSALRFDICRPALVLLFFSRYVLQSIDTGLMPHASDVALHVLPLVWLFILTDALTERFSQQWKRRAAIFLRGRADAPYRASADPLAPPRKIDEIAVGSTLLLAEREVVPCDSVITSGVAEVAECRLSGISRQIVKGSGDRLYGGSVLNSGSVTAQTIALADESAITFSEDVVRPTIRCDVAQQLDETQHVGEQIAMFGLLFIAALAAIAWSDRGVPLYHALSMSEAVLVIGLLLAPLKMAGLFIDCAVIRMYWRGAIVKSRQAWGALARARCLLIDSQVHEQLRSPEIREFSILDARLDAQGLLSALYSIHSRSEDPYHVALARHVRATIAAPVLLSVSDFRTYPDGGLSGLVEGAEFTIGTEALLVERGVKVAPSDVDEVAHEGRLVLIALEDEVVARAVVGDAFRQEVQQACHQLTQIGVRPVLYGSAGSELARACALDSGDVWSDLDVATISERMAHRNAVILSDQPDQALRARSLGWISFFDELRFDMSRSDVTVFNGGLMGVCELFTTARYGETARRVVVYSCAVLAAMLLLCAVSALAPAWVVLLSVVLFQAFVMLAIILAAPLPLGQRR